MKNTMTNDIEFQAKFVVSNAWRLLSLQDQDKASPTYGSFDYKFWRDKSVDFPDARFQEAAATLLLVSRRRGSDVLDEQFCLRLEESYVAGLKFLASIQYIDGSFDEWYKGERGFAATEFVTIAYGLSRIFGGTVGNDDDKILLNLIRKTCDWLEKKHDYVKANHEAAAGAALAIGWKITGNINYLNSAKNKVNETLSRQNKEGWFPEIGGMDLGYCSVLMDYIMLYSYISGDQSVLPSMKKLMNFMYPLINPDLTINPDLGLCLNPYVSRVGIGLLSQYDDNAALIIGRFQSYSPGFSGLSPTLGDDLRLCRWSYLPIVAAHLQSQFRAKLNLEFVQNDHAWTYFQESGIGLFQKSFIKLIFSVCGGGGLYIYKKNKKIAAYKGIVFYTNDQRWASRGYNPERFVRVNDNLIIAKFSHSPVKGFNPSFIARAILRLACLTAYGSTITRAMIDHIRIKTRSAINQSSTPIDNGEEGIEIIRNIAVLEKDITVCDEIILSKKLNSASMLIDLGDDGDEMISLPYKDRFMVEIIINIDSGKKSISIN